ncbi:MAG: hypothetical protein AB7V04_07100 [Desulfomonilaceae bacterium]
MKYKVGIDIIIKSMHYVEVEADNEDSAWDMVAKCPEDFIVDWDDIVNLGDVETNVEDVFEVDGKDE